MALVTGRKTGSLSPGPTKGGILKTLFLAIAAGGLAVSPVAASAQAYQAERVLKTMDAGDLSAVLTNMGASWDVVPRDDDTDLYQITFANGLKAFAWFRVCDGGQCRGLTLLAAYARDEAYSNDAVLDAKLRAFNDSAPAGKAFRSTGDSILSQAYIISDNGITMANIQSQIEVFISSCDSLDQFLSQP